MGRGQKSADGAAAGLLYGAGLAAPVRSGTWTREDQPAAVLKELGEEIRAGNPRRALTIIEDHRELIAEASDQAPLPLLALSELLIQGAAQGLATKSNLSGPIAEDEGRHLAEVYQWRLRRWIEDPRSCPRPDLELGDLFTRAGAGGATGPAKSLAERRIVQIGDGMDLDPSEWQVLDGLSEEEASVSKPLLEAAIASKELVFGERIGSIGARFGSNDFGMIGVSGNRLSHLAPHRGARGPLCGMEGNLFRDSHPGEACESCQRTFRSTDNAWLIPIWAEVARTALERSGEAARRGPLSEELEQEIANVYAGILAENGSAANLAATVSHAAAERDDLDEIFAEALMAPRQGSRVGETLFDLLRRS